MDEEQDEAMLQPTRPRKLCSPFGVVPSPVSGYYAMERVMAVSRDKADLTPRCWVDTSRALRW